MKEQKVQQDKTKVQKGRKLEIETDAEQRMWQ